MKKHHLFFKIVFVFALILGSVLIVLARAGGGGGGGSDGGFSGSGGGDSGIGELIVYIIMALPFPWNLIAAGSLIGLGYYFNKVSKQKTILNKIPATTGDFIDKLNKVKNLDPHFDIIAFSEKVKHAFIKIQEAWSQQSIRPIRKFISDGLYQRFMAQFIMMKQIEQENVISDIKILDVKVIDIEVDGNYLVMDVAISASMLDKFVSKKIPSIKELYNEPFVEIWTFIRKIGYKQGGDLYLGQHCPQCGAALEDLESEACQCPYCKTILNTGEFDWILSEITQVDDYPIAKKISAKLSGFKSELSSLYARDPYFSVQWLEDKASNAFMQVLVAYALNDPKRLRRFSDNEFFDNYKPGEKIIYSRLYLNFVTLTGIWQQDNMDYLSFYIRASFRRLRTYENNFEWIDLALTSHSYVLVLKRESNAALPKGSLYVHQCPHCGGTLEDTASITCPYCGEEMNSPKHEWIVYQLMTPEEFQEYSLQFFSQKVKDPQASLLKIRDYVINNVCVVLASDGVIDEIEMNYITKLAKKLGYSPSKLEGLLNLAQKGQLKLLFPSSAEDRSRVLKQMKKAAEVNQHITDEEKAILTSFEKNAA